MTEKRKLSWGQGGGRRTLNGQKCEKSLYFCTRLNQEQKLLRQPHKCPPHPQFNVVWMTEKRKFNPIFPTLIMGAGGRPTYFKMAKNVKNLIIFARDCLRWSCLGVSCPKFEILPKSSDQDDMRLTYFNQLTESFLSPKM
jgi:hypothetical protein